MPTQPDAKQYPVQNLLNCKLFVLDLDGTVYQETNHFSYYGERLAAQLPESKRAAYLEDVTNVLSRKRTLQYGDAYDAVQRMIVRDGKVYNWSGERMPEAPGGRLEYVDDPWGIYGVTARYHGVAPEALQDAFMETRAHMESDAYPMMGMPGLRAAIDDLKSLGVQFVLATNSPEPDSRTILSKLDLTGVFAMEVFDAKKQINAPTHFRNFRDALGVPFEEMVSVGDHYRNEIAPAIQLGMKTICIDRYVQPERPTVDVVVHHPSELASVFQQVTETRRQASL